MLNLLTHLSTFLHLLTSLTLAHTPSFLLCSSFLSFFSSLLYLFLKKNISFPFHRQSTPPFPPTFTFYPKNLLESSTCFNLPTHLPYPLPSLTTLPFYSTFLTLLILYLLPFSSITTTTNTIDIATPDTQTKRGRERERERKRTRERINVAVRSSQARISRGGGILKALPAPPNNIGRLKFLESLRRCSVGRIREGNKTEP